MKTLIIISLLLFPVPTLAQSATELFKKGDAFDKAGKTGPALKAYLAADQKKPNQVPTLTKIAKQYGDSMASLKNEASKKRAGQQSLAYSRKALKADQKSSEANLSVAISLGKMVEFMGNKEKIQTSRKIKSHADTALQLNPRSDYAHHLLGRWHQNLAEMGFTTRSIARLIYGEVPKASFDTALKHFATARRIKPNRLIHELEYGRTLALMKRQKEAHTILTKALAKPNREPDDAAAKVRARASLKAL
jgi:tetratricopeptide (TPR) repeat protein